MIPELSTAYTALVRERTRIDDAIKALKPFINFPVEDVAAAAGAAASAGPPVDAEVRVPQPRPPASPPVPGRGKHDARVLVILQDAPALGLTCKEVARELAGPAERNDSDAMKRYVSSAFGTLARLVDEDKVVKDARLYRLKERS